MRKKSPLFSRRYLIMSKVEGVYSKVATNQKTSYMCDYWKNGIAVFVEFATIKLTGSKPREK